MVVHLSQINHYRLWTDFIIQLMPSTHFLAQIYHQQKIP